MFANVVICSESLGYCKPVLQPVKGAPNWHKRELTAHVSEPLSTWQAAAICWLWMGEQRRKQPCLGVFFVDILLTDSLGARWFFQAVTQTLFWVKTSSSEATPEGIVRGRYHQMCHCVFFMNVETMIRVFSNTLWPKSDK